MQHKKRILVLGGTGFIGINLVKALNDDNYAVTVYSRGITPVDERVNDVEYVVGDAGNYGQLDEVMKNMDYVAHFASSSNPKSSENDLMFDLTSNLQATITILELCVKNKIKKLLYCSSGGTVYGIPQILPVSENAFPSPISSYGIVKYIIENYIKYFNYKFGLKYYILRLSNPYGPFQSPHRTQGIVAIFMHHILQGQKIDVFGDGNIVRDYIYIDDFSKLCLKCLKSKSYNVTVNAGFGKGTSIIELINEISKVTKKKADINYLPARNFDVHTVYLDIMKAKFSFGWEPTVDLNTGLSKTYDWLQNEMKNKRI